MVTLNGKLIKGNKVTRKVNGNTVKVGTMSRSRKFFMEKDQRKGHLKYKEDAFGMNEDVFKKVQDNAEKIVVLFKDNTGQKFLYASNPEDWRQHGIVKKEGAETQRFLPRKHMNKTKISAN